MNNTDIFKPIETDENWEAKLHRDPTEEFMFYSAVAAGLVEVVQENCANRVFENPDGVGKLSDNPVTNLRYHFVVTAAMIARFCAEGGMAWEEAYGLSDSYIQRMDRCTDLAGIVLLHDQMSLDFTRRMRSMQKNSVCSKPVKDAIDYIYVHVRERITINDLAAAVYTSPTHLSHIFKKQTGVSVSDYIRRLKVNTAKSLLRFSNLDLVDISNLLSYSSQSHFIQQFHSQVGMTPKAYRDLNYLNSFGVNRETDGFSE